MGVGIKRIISLKPPHQITPGGSTTSQEINAWMRDDSTNVMAIYNAVQDAQDEVDRVSNLLSIQSSSYASAIAALTTAIESGGYPTFDGVYLDFHSNSGVYGATTASVSTVYGQATLPSLNTPQNQLLVRDATNYAWVPKGTRVYYALGSDTPSTWTEITDKDELMRAVDDQSSTALLVPMGDESDIWIKATVPINLMENRLSNSIAIHPVPEFGCTLLSAYYTSSGSNGPELATAGGEVGTSRRWLFGPRPIDEVTFHYQLSVDNTPTGVAYFGIIMLACYYYQFQSVAQLVVDVSQWRDDDITSVTVYSPSSTQPVVSSIAGQQATIDLQLLPGGEPQLITALAIEC